APYNDLAALEHIAAHNPRVVAVLVEPVQGEAGICLPDADYLAGLRRLCDAQGWWLMLDEVQTGNGRCGRYFAAQQHGIEADAIARAMGRGTALPIGACLARGTASDTSGPGQHGSTFGGNPLACAVAQTVVKTIVDEHLASNATRQGEALRAGLQAGLAGV